MKDTIAPEMAEQEFNRMCGFFDVDTDDIDDDGQKDFDRVKAKIVKAITKGKLTIADDGAPTYTSAAGTPLTFSAPTGATLMTKTPDEDPMRKMMAYVRALTGGKASPAKLTIPDTGVLIAIVTLFMSELL